MEKDVPMISGDDYNAILEESSLQEATDEVIQDTNELTHETASVIEETIDVINSTEEIEAAENAGLLSAITVKAYSNRVNSYLDKLESRYIITKDDKLKPGLQFDNPKAGLLSIKDTIKAAVRKVIEWISKAIAYSLNATSIIYNKLSDFIRSRASISKKLKEDLDKMLKSSSDTFYVDTSAYNKILTKNGLLFSYHTGGSLSAKEIEGTDALMNRLSIAVAITKSKLEVQNFLKIFQDILKEFSISRLPNVVKDGDKTVSIVSDGKDINGVEKFLTDIVFSKLGRSMKVGDFRGVWLPGMLTTGESAPDKDKEISINEFNYSKTRMIIHSAYNPNAAKGRRFADYASFILYSKQNLSIAALSAVELDFSNSAKDLEINTAISTGDIKPYLFKKEIEELYKSVEKSIEVLKKMPSESSSRLDKINKYLKDNIESMKKEGMAEGDNHGAIFNPELKMKLKMIVQQQFFFPAIVSSEIKMLSGLVNDGIALLKASIGEHANIENVSKTKESSVEKPVLLIAPPERYSEIIDVEVID